MVVGVVVGGGMTSNGPWFWRAGNGGQAGGRRAPTTTRTACVWGVGGEDACVSVVRMVVVSIHKKQAKGQESKSRDVVIRARQFKLRMSGLFRGTEPSPAFA